MPEMERNMSSAFSIVSSAGAGSRKTGRAPGAALSVAGGGAPVRHASPDLTSAPASRVYNLPAASGQRPAASGQRPAASGQRPAASGQNCVRQVAFPANRATA